MFVLCRVVFVLCCVVFVLCCVCVVLCCVVSRSCWLSAKDVVFGAAKEFFSRIQCFGGLERVPVFHPTGGSTRISPGGIKYLIFQPNLPRLMVLV